MGGDNRKCKKCKTLLYNKYSYKCDDENYFCVKCYFYKFILPILKNSSVSKKDIEDFKAYYFLLNDRVIN